MQLTSKWHFPRTQLAQSYVQQLQAGLSSIAIFAERRKGKTEFLLEDLTPALEKAGFRCAYINFWELKTDPIHCIVKGIERSLKQHNRQLLKGWQKDINIKVPGIELKSINLPKEQQAFAYDAMELLLENKGDVVLMFDEIQHLASDEKFEPLIATLRTFLDTNRKRVRAVFTGSSQSRLNRIFKHHKSAFYRGASLVNFPDMDEQFVAYLIGVYEKLTSVLLDEQKANQLFAQFHYSPFILVDLMQTMMREGISDFDEGLNYYQQTNDVLAPWRKVWGSLKLIDQLLLTQIVVHQKPIYHQDTYELMADLLGIEQVTRGMLQSSLTRLKDKGLVVSVARGQFELESQEFLQFLTDL